MDNFKEFALLFLGAVAVFVFSIGLTAVTVIAALGRVFKRWICGRGTA